MSLVSPDELAWTFLKTYFTVLVSCSTIVSIEVIYPGSFIAALLLNVTFNLHLVGENVKQIYSWLAYHSEKSFEYDL